MLTPEITNVSIAIELGNLVSEMDHLIDGVVEDIHDAQDRGLSLREAMDYLKSHYWGEERVPRLFILHVIERMVDELDELRSSKQPGSEVIDDGT